MPVDDSDASSPLKMQENEGLQRSGTVLDESEKMKFESGNGANLGNEMEEYDKFSPALFEPVRLLAELKGYAQGAEGTSMLEFTVLKSCLSAFYRAKGGYRLPSFSDAKPVPGLEDKSGDRAHDISDYIGEVRVQGPEEEYWISSPKGHKHGQTSQNLVRKGQPVGNQRGRQRSLNEIMEGGVGFDNKDRDRAETVVNVKSGGKKWKKSVDVDNNEELTENLGCREKADGSANGNGNSKELLNEESFSRERKKSKYLSPPYVNADRGLGKKSTGEGHKSDSLGLRTQTRDKAIDPMLVKAPAIEVLSEIWSAALSPLHLKGTDSVDLAEQFCSAFRSFSDCSESNGEFGNHHRRMRKVEVSNLNSSLKEQSQAEPSNSSPEFISQQKKIRKSEATNLNEQKEKQDAVLPVTGTEKINESSNKTSGASLIVSFGPCSTLPKKSDLIEIYRKFGPLDEKETEMFYTNRCARVVFLKRSEAEEACHVSQLSSPFPAATTTFSVRNISEIKSRGHKGVSIKKPLAPTLDGGKTRRFPAEPKHSDNLTELNFVKEKLEKIALLIETSEGKISEDLKSRLELEVEVLLEEVSTMVKN